MFVDLEKGVKINRLEQWSFSLNAVRMVYDRKLYSTLNKYYNMKV